MKLQINATRNDYIEFSKYSYSRLLGHSQSTSNNMLKNMIIWFFITIIILSIINNSGIDLKSFHLPSALVTAVPLLLFIGYIIFYNKKFQKLALPKEDGLLLGNKAIEMSETGIIETNSYGQAYYKWSAVESVEEVNGNVYLFFDTMLGYVFPNSCFKDNEERIKLIEYIKQKIA